MSNKPEKNLEEHNLQGKKSTQTGEERGQYIESLLSSTIDMLDALGVNAIISYSDKVEEHVGVVKHPRLDSEIAMSLLVYSIGIASEHQMKADTLVFCCDGEKPHFLSCNAVDGRSMQNIEDRKTLLGLLDQSMEDVFGKGGLVSDNKISA